MFFSFYFLGFQWTLVYNKNVDRKTALVFVFYCTINYCQFSPEINKSKNIYSFDLTKLTISRFYFLENIFIKVYKQYVVIINFINFKLQI